MLAGQMGENIALGWAAHLMIGVILALVYGLVALFLVGPPAVRGASYGIAPWLVRQIAVMPMMGSPFVQQICRDGDGEPAGAPDLRRGPGRAVRLTRESGVPKTALA